MLQILRPYRPFQRNDRALVLIPHHGFPHVICVLIATVVAQNSPVDDVPQLRHPAPLSRSVIFTTHLHKVMLLAHQWPDEQAYRQQVIAQSASRCMLRGRCHAIVAKFSRRHAQAAGLKGLLARTRLYMLMAALLDFRTNKSTK